MGSAVDIEMYEIKRLAKIMYLSGRLMAEDMFVLHNHGPYAPSMPEMHVGTAHVCKIGGSSAVLQLDTYPHIPVLRISTTTSPSAGTVPD